jgi:lipopolysaccharide biosynthesis regulator YciM
MNPLVSILIILIGIAFAIWVFTSLQRRSQKRFPVPSPYTEALSYLVDGHLNQAAQKFREAAQMDTTNVDAFIRLANIYRDTGKLQRAIKIHTELTFRANISSSQRSEVYKMLALDFVAAGNVIRALEYVDTLLNQNKKDLWGLEFKRKLLEQRGDFHVAFEQEKMIQTLNDAPNPKRLALMKTQEGIELFHQGKGREARLRFREAVKILPGCAPAYLTWGDSYLKEERAQEAVTIWARFMKSNSTQSYLAFRRMESVLFDLGRFGEMEGHYRKVLASRPGDVHAIVGLAKFFFRMGEKTMALDALKSGLEMNPSSLWIRRNMIHMYSEMKAMDQVLDLAHDLLERVMTDEDHFKCGTCGRTTTEATWFCPECRSWDSYDL